MADQGLIAAGVVTGGVSIMANVLSQQAQSTKSNPYWYDFINQYYRISEEYTRDIDTLLMTSKHSRVGTKVVFDANVEIPDVGKHYFLYDPQRRFSVGGWGCILLEKRESKVDNSSNVVYFYLCVVSPIGDKTFAKFQEMLFGKVVNETKVVSIDTSTSMARLLMVNKICEEPTVAQNQALQLIIGRYTPEFKHNVKVMLYGEVGTKKSYTGRVLKKRLEHLNQGITVRLYDDFDPTSSGVNINALALQYANPLSPVIIVADEIDIAFHNAVSCIETYDPRLRHAKNKSTLNAMMDVMGDKRHVIVIYTTNKTPQQLAAEPNYHSFIRQGRIDMWLHMEAETCSQTPAPSLTLAITE